MPQHPGIAKEALQRGWCRLGLPAEGGSGEQKKWDLRSGELIPSSLILPSLPGAPYVRTKIFLEASRWVRLEQQPPDKAMKS